MPLQLAVGHQRGHPVQSRQFSAGPWLNPRLASSQVSISSIPSDTATANTRLRRRASATANTAKALSCCSDGTSAGQKASPISRAK